MKSQPFEAWKAELLSVGNIVQDGDLSVTPGERERQFNRYLELLDELTGKEGLEYARAVVQSVQAQHDYGAYQAASRALWRFEESEACAALVQELPRLIRDLPDWAGDFMVQVANAEGTVYEPVVGTFNRRLLDLPPESLRCVVEFIDEQERSGWLEHQVGVLRVKA